MEERRKILEMVAQGKLSPDEAERLLSALKEQETPARFLKVRVYDRNKNKLKVKVDIPISVLKVGTKIGAVFKGMIPANFKNKMANHGISLEEFTPEMIDQILDEVAEKGKFTIAEVTDEEDGESVEVFIE